jgi:hypothetical protein
MKAARGIEDRCRYDLTIASVFQNEAPYLKEWIEFHRMIGVQHFVLVNDRSTDDFMAVLEPYIEAGEVELLTLPCPPEWHGRTWTSFQCAVLQSICKQQRGVSRWLAMIDLDEFIVPMETEDLLEVLDEHEARGGLYVRWESFGTSRVARLASDDLLTERMYLRWRFIPGRDVLGKSIVKPHRVHKASIHRCELLPGYDYADSNPGMESPSPHIKIHHYWSRDEYSLLHEKLPRMVQLKGWELDEEKIAFFKELFNEVPDHSMNRFIPELRQRVFSTAPASALRAPDRHGRGSR